MKLGASASATLGVARIRSTCSCTAPTMLVDGELRCGRCGAGLTADVPSEDGDVVRTDDAKLPRGWSRRRLREVAPQIPGARREGGRSGRGVVWIVPRRAFLALLASKPKAKAVQTLALSSDEALAEAALHESGVRFTRRAG